MTLVWLYVVGAACELIGGGLAAVEIWQAGITWRDKVNAPPGPDEHAAFYGLDRMYQGLEDIFTGNRTRRLAAVLLLAAGVAVGLAGNLASLSSSS